MFTIFTIFTMSLVSTDDLEYLVEEACWSMGTWSDDRYAKWRAAARGFEKCFTEAILSAPKQTMAGHMEFDRSISPLLARLELCLKLASRDIVRDGTDPQLLVELSYDDAETLLQCNANTHVRTYNIILEALCEIDQACRNVIQQSCADPELPLHHQADQFILDKRGAGEIIGVKKVKEKLRRGMWQAGSLRTNIGLRYEMNPASLGLEPEGPGFCQRCEHCLLGICTARSESSLTQAYRWLLRTQYHRARCVAHLGPSRVAR